MRGYGTGTRLGAFESQGPGIGESRPAGGQLHAEKRMLNDGTKPISSLESTKPQKNEPKRSPNEPPNARGRELRVGVQLIHP